VRYCNQPLIQIQKVNTSFAELNTKISKLNSAGIHFWNSNYVKKIIYILGLIVLVVFLFGHCQFKMKKMTIDTVQL
jgi:hypothetical protein